MSISGTILFWSLSPPRSSLPGLGLDREEFNLVNQAGALFQGEAFSVKQVKLQVLLVITLRD